MTFWYNKRDDFRTKRLVGVIVIVGVLVASIIMLGFSFKTIDFNEYGLKQNVFTREIETQVYEEGFYTIGFWNDFLIFPSTWETIAFTPHPLANDIPISVQTKNGLLVEIDVSFQFKLRKSSLLDLYSQYGLMYLDYIQAVARSALREIAGDYNAEQLYANRTAVNGAMNSALYDAINSIVDVGEFQLRSINFPISFQEAVEQYEVWRIEVEIAQLEQEAELVRQQTLLLVAEYTANQTIVEYEGIATALEALRLSLNFTQEQLLTYLWIETIQTHDQSYLFIGLADFPFLVPLNNATV